MGKGTITFSLVLRLGLLLTAMVALSQCGKAASSGGSSSGYPSISLQCGSNVCVQ